MGWVPTAGWAMAQTAIPLRSVGLALADGTQIRLRGGGEDRVARGDPEKPFPWDAGMLSREIEFPFGTLSASDLKLAREVDRVQTRAKLAGFDDLANQTLEEILHPEIEFKVMDAEGNLHDLNGISTQKLVQMGDEEDWYNEAGYKRKLEEFALGQKQEAERTEARLLARRQTELKRERLRKERGIGGSDGHESLGEATTRQTQRGVYVTPGAGITEVYHDEVENSDSEAVPEGPRLGELAVDLRCVERIHTA